MEAFDLFCTLLCGLPALSHLIVISTYKVGTVIITVLELSKEKVREVK